MAEKSVKHSIYQEAMSIVPELLSGNKASIRARIRVFLRGKTRESLIKNHCWCYCQDIEICGV
jgi:hypothetical protein